MVSSRPSWSLPTPQLSFFGGLCSLAGSCLRMARWLQLLVVLRPAGGRLNASAPGPGQCRLLGTPEASDLAAEHGTASAVLLMGRSHSNHAKDKTALTRTSGK